MVKSKPKSLFLSVFCQIIASDTIILKRSGVPKKNLAFLWLSFAIEKKEGTYYLFLRSSMMSVLRSILNLLLFFTWLVPDAK